MSRSFRNIILSFDYDENLFEGDEDDAVEQVVAAIREVFGDSLCCVEQEITGAYQGYTSLYSNPAIDPDEDEEETPDEDEEETPDED